MSISELQMSGISVVKSLKDFDWSWSSCYIVEALNRFPSNF